MNPQLSQIIAQSRQEDLLRAAEQARMVSGRPRRTSWSRRFHWTVRIPGAARVLAPRVRVA